MATTPKQAARTSAKQAELGQPQRVETAFELTPEIVNFDRDQLPEKIRMHLLAKQLGVASKELTAIYAQLGLKKVAQSTLSRAESHLLFDSLALSAGKPEGSGAESDKSAEGAASEPTEKTAKKPAKKQPKAKKATKKKESQDAPAAAAQDAAQDFDASTAEAETQREQHDEAQAEDQPQPKKKARAKRKTQRKAKTKKSAPVADESDAADASDAAKSQDTEGQPGSGDAAPEPAPPSEADAAAQSVEEEQDAKAEKSERRRARRATRSSRAKKATSRRSDDSPAAEETAVTGSDAAAAPQPQEVAEAAEQADATNVPDGAATETGAADEPAPTPRRRGRRSATHRSRRTSFAEDTPAAAAAKAAEDDEAAESADAAEAAESASESAASAERPAVVADTEQATNAAASSEQASPATSSSEGSAADAELSEEDKKLRYRVRKNVENEIHQIEHKVERELKERAAEESSPEATPAPATEEDAAEAAETPAPTSATSGAIFSSPEQDGEERDASYGESDAPAAAEADGIAEPVAVPVFQAPIFLPPTEELLSAAQSTQSAQSAQSASTEFDADAAAGDHAAAQPGDTDSAAAEETSEDDQQGKRRRRGRRGSGRGRGSEERQSGRSSRRRDDGADAEQAEPETEEISEPKGIKGSTRLEAQRRRRSEMREKGRVRRHIVSQAEFLARRESVDRTMVVRERQRQDHPGRVTQVGVLEDDMLVEHFVTSEDQSSLIGNIYLGRVQNVLPAMEAAFIDIGTGRNGVIYSGEVDWKSAGLGGRSRRIEQALRSGDQVLVQVTKDPIGHKGARLTTQISLAGRYMVYAPGGRSAGISRKLPAPERTRLKEILRDIMPKDGGAIIRTAAEGVSERAIAADFDRLHALWEDIQRRAEDEKASKGAQPVTLYEEPNVLVKVVRDLFNEDFSRLVVDGERAWNTVHAYVQSVAPDLLDRVQKWDRAAHDGADAFARFRVDEQIHKALARKVWLPSGGTLIIDRTEAMTVIDVNTGKFTGAGGNLEETVTTTNLEAAEEIVRQLRLRDIGGMIVIDFIDMVLPENRDLVLRRLTEYLGRDRTRHQVSEVTSLGLVQLTRKRLGTGLLETFASECEHCEGRGVILHEDPIEEGHEPPKRARKQDPRRHPAAVKMEQRRKTDEELVDAVLAPVEDTTDEAADDSPDASPENATRSERGGRGGRGRGSRRRSARQAARTADRGDDEGQRTEVAQVVAEAVQKADAEDADEPSGRDYVPVDGAPDAADEPRRRGRRRASRGGRGRSQHEVTPANNSSFDEETSADDRADERPAVHGAKAGTEGRGAKASGAAESGAAKSGTAESSAAADGADDSATAPRSARRGRRAVRRVVRRSVDGDQFAADDAAREDAAAQTGDAPTASTDTPADESPEAGARGRRGRRRVSRRTASRSRRASTGSGTGASRDAKSGAPESKRSRVAQQKSFAQAQAEFEASPRRKRRTRGNSRSDHAPRPEDFGIADSGEQTAGGRQDARPEQTEEESRSRRVRRSARRRR